MSARRHSALAVLTICAALLGCAPEPLPMQLSPPSAPRAGKAMIYVYLEPPKVDLGLGGGAPVLIDGDPVRALPLGAYLAVEVEPGRHAVALQSHIGFGIYGAVHNTETADVAPGGRAYFEVKDLAVIARAQEVGAEAVAGLRMVPAAPPVASPPEKGPPPSPSAKPRAPRA